MSWLFYLGKKLANMWRSLNFAERLEVLRLAFAGGVAGIALVSCLFWALGVPQSQVWEIVGGAVGFTLVTAAKLLPA